MTQLATMTPSIFGPSGAGQPEQGRLDATLARVGELCRELETGQSDLDPRRVLSELRADLALHFALEEGDTHFGTIVRERPALTRAVEGLKQEHLALLEQLDALRTEAQTSEQRADLDASTIALIRAFREHEHKEGELVQELVLRDDGVAAD
jgi:hypothetical protein